MPSRTLLAATLAAIGIAANAQEPAPVTMPTVPPNNCVKPELPGPSASAARMKQFNETYKNYGECIKKYIEGAKSLADAALAAGNAAVGEYNKLTEEIKAHNAEISKQN